MRVAVLIPTLNRPHALEPLIESLAAVTPPGTYKTIFVCDTTDQPTIDELHRLNALYVLCGGTYPVKTNAGYRASETELILPTADDVVFHDGWYKAAVEAFADESVQVVGTRDLSPITETGNHVTMPIVRRTYIQNPGAAHNESDTVFHEGYHHNYVETELWQLAQHRDVARFVPECVIEHRHPLWGTAQMDDTYQRGAFTGEPADRGLFESRRTAWRAHAPV